jgi:hypothetical protein
MGEVRQLKPTTNDSVYIDRELQKVEEVNPGFKAYLDKNGYRPCWCSRSNEVIVTDGEDVDMGLGLFVAIYRSHCK